MAKKYYAFHLTDGNVKGIVEDWNDCKTIVSGLACKYMSFKCKSEAQDWLDNSGSFVKKTFKVLEEGIYFDAGKRGEKSYTRVRVSNSKNEDLLPLLKGNGQFLEFENDRTYANRYTSKPNFVLKTYNGNLCVELDIKKTNNAGELIGFLLACEIARKLDYTGPKKIFGDSKLILDYWSKGVYNKKNVNSVESDTINKVVKIREELESKGFTFGFVSGDVNPADLGDHK